jgi:protein TonB
VKEPAPQTELRGGQARPRIVDVVFGVITPESRLAGLAAVAIALGSHGALMLWASRFERSLESWSAAVAARVHAELSREQFVELAPTPAPPPPVDPPEPERAPPKTRAVSRRPAEARPPPPAQAGKVVAREPNPNAPVDLSGETFVVGSASTYAGGVTTPSGTNPVAVQTRDVDPRSPPGSGEADHSSAVALEDPDWRCPWPREAEDEQIDRQIAMVRVVVRPDGSVESAQILSDAGHGFGQAAVACAMRTQFVPARDARGRAIRAQSPPIRVRFTR